ncbi:G patch domain-containing protein 1 [Protopterus annectens]|uniref:G patch domain-containing protein 1 n=1 Tax=Protopterus annectens TaxID=7888 RepID=UPI001CF989BA|nr:G patch domain-containing protein 1 [Protopterus annectens]
MASQDSDSDEDFVIYGTPSEPLEEDERPKKPVPIQDQTVKDEKGRYKRFHGAFTGGFSAGYFNTVGTKEGWAPSAFVSSRQSKAERMAFNPEDFMDEEDLGEHGIAPRDIMTTDDFASKTKDKIKEKARVLAAVAAPIPGATILEDLIAPAKISIGIKLLRKMGWKEGQGIGPRVKRRSRKQEPDPGVKIYGCALPDEGSFGSEDEDDYQPESVSFAPKDIMPIDLTAKDNTHGLGYRGIDPRHALFGNSGGCINIFSADSERSKNLLGDIVPSKGRKLGISGQAFGVGALEEDDDDIYARDSLHQYDTVIQDEEPGDGLYGWTAPKQYKSLKKGMKQELRYIGKILDGFCLAAKPASPKKIFPPPTLPVDYRPVHYFRPVLQPGTSSTKVVEALLSSSGQHITDLAQKGRHQLDASKRKEILGETTFQGVPGSVFDLLSDKDKERITEVKKVALQKTAEVKGLVQQSSGSQFCSVDSAEACDLWTSAQRGEASSSSSDFKPFAKNPEKQKRYDEYMENLKQGQKDSLKNCLDPSMTEWERGRELEEFSRAALLYKSTSSVLSSRFTHAKYEDETDKVTMPRDQEGDITDKESAVKMKMFGKLTRETFEWHPDKLLCKRFNIPDPYPGSSAVGLPTVKRDKYSVFNFLTLPEKTLSKVAEEHTMKQAISASNCSTKSSVSERKSRWDISAEQKQHSDVSSAATPHRSLFIPQVPKESETKKTDLPPQETPKSESQSIREDEGETESRPSMDLFKAIFASSSDEDSSTSDENSDEEGQAAVAEKKSEQPDFTPVITQEHPKHQVTLEKTVFPVQASERRLKEPVKEVMKEVDTDEQFGPKLPPSFISGISPQTSDTLPLPDSVSLRQKEKHKKKRKEKHKNKKEHKHKKEKKVAFYS